MHPTFQLAPGEYFLLRIIGEYLQLTMGSDLQLKTFLFNFFSENSLPAIFLRCTEFILDPYDSLKMFLISCHCCLQRPSGNQPMFSFSCRQIKNPFNLVLLRPVLGKGSEKKTGVREAINSEKKEITS